MRPTLQAALGCVLAMTVAGSAALALGQPMLFPSLGPTVMMLAQHPGQTATAPRSIVLAHGAGLVAGWLSLAVCGLLHAPSALATGLDGAHVVAAALSVALTVTATRLLTSPHPPAGATTLIVSLGLLPSLRDLVVMWAAVACVTGVMTAYNRCTVQPAPLWRAG